MTNHEAAGSRIALVTGGSSGIGQAAAVQLARRGTGVVLTFNTNADRAGETVASIEAAGGAAVALPLDVADSSTFGDFAVRLVEVLRDRWGRDTFDHLVNNAGFGHAAPFADTTEDVFDELFRTHLRGPFFLMQRLLPLLVDGGAIVNLTSRSAGIAGYSAYASMKGGVEVLTRTLAQELGGRGIRVNAVSPGPTRTRIADDAFAHHPEVIPPLVAQTALGRLGEGEDIGRAIAALLSDDCGWITGENVEVSGGFDL